MSEKPEVYFVDDEESMREAARSWLSLSGFAVTVFDKPAAVLARVSPAFRGVVVTDVKMPSVTGLELLSRIREVDADLPVVLITGHGDVSMAVDAMHHGAYDFLEKPYDPEKLVEVLNRAAEKRKLITEVRQLRDQLESVNGVDSHLLGNSKESEHLRQSILKLAPINVNVLINGETGSGKELVARCLHEYSPRRQKPFVALNCGAVPESIFENELFGHESGAFTGATRRRIGKVEYANGGTLFLDEIESMPLDLQVKLLRVLQENEIERLGSNETISLDLRVVAASKADLRELSQKGGFRADLYYRLGVAELNIPPLRERKADILLLFEYFCARAAKKLNLSPRPIGPEEVRSLCAYDWPGNIRELRNIAERHTLGIWNGLEHIVAQSATAEGSENGQLPDPNQHTYLVDQVHQFERQLIEQALQRHKGNIKAVLTELGIPRRTLNQKMVKYGLSRPVSSG